MDFRVTSVRAPSLIAALAVAAVTACSNGTTSSTIPAVQNSAQSPGTALTQTSNTSNIIYDTNPPRKFAMAAAKPGAFPPPSFCVAHFHLACYTPALIRSAYNVPNSLLGAGQTIVIVDAYGSPTIRTDLQTFDLAMGLPDTTLNIYYPTGKPPAILPAHLAYRWAGETDLDVQWAHAIAPKAKIDLVIASNNYGNVLNKAVEFAVSHHLGNVLSMSYGIPEIAIAGRGNNIQLKQAHENFVAAISKGITLFASSGDGGATNFGTVISAQYPASDPLVTSVGGTNLFMSDAGAYQRETVWNDSNDCPFGCKDGVFGATGGAPSIIFAAPAYQKALSGMNARTTSDVGYNASVYTGVLVYLGWANPKGFYFFGGTSEGSPQWAALTALADQAAGHPLGLINPKLYAIGASASKYAADFHDVTVGNNDWNGKGFPAKRGYDLPTGLGSPNATNLINDLK